MLMFLVVVDVTCYTGVGERYRGDVSHTLDGYTCNPGTLCRNRDLSEPQPWCYTSQILPNGNAFYDICDVPKCPGKLLQKQSTI